MPRSIDCIASICWRRASSRLSRSLSTRSRSQLAGEQRGKTPVPRRRSTGKRLEELGRAGVVAQRRRQHRKQGGEAKAVGGARVLLEGRLCCGERRLLLQCRRARGLEGVGNDAVHGDHVGRLRLEQRAARE